MDLIEKLRRINGLVYIVDDMPDYDHEIAHVAADEIERLRKALQSIANNTCCDSCQEAALVARAALKESE